MTALILAGGASGLILREVVLFVAHAWAEYQRSRRPLLNPILLQLNIERAPFLPDAQREVDAMFPGSRPIAPPLETQKALSPLPATFAQQVAAVRAVHYCEPASYGSAGWAVLSNEALVGAYWRARDQDNRALPAIRREMERRYGRSNVEAVDRTPVEERPKR